MELELNPELPDVTDEVLALELVPEFAETPGCNFASTTPSAIVMTTDSETMLRWIIPARRTESCPFGLEPEVKLLIQILPRGNPINHMWIGASIAFKF